MTRTTMVTERPVMPFELAHRTGCPAAENRLPGSPDDPTNHRKAIGIEAYVVNGTGRYNRETGDFEAVPQTGVVRCLECANQTLVPTTDIPIIQAIIIAPVLQKAQS